MLYENVRRPVAGAEAGDGGGIEVTLHEREPGRPPISRELSYEEALAFHEELCLAIAEVVKRERVGAAVSHGFDRDAVARRIVP